jgi:hypothetical protein
MEVDDLKHAVTKVFQSLAATGRAATAELQDLERLTGTEDEQVAALERSVKRVRSIMGTAPSSVDNILSEWEH